MRTKYVVLIPPSRVVKRQPSSLHASSGQGSSHGLIACLATIEGFVHTVVLVFAMIPKKPCFNLCARRAVKGALRYSRQNAAALWRHVTTVEDSASLRQQLPSLGLLAFVADGAILPRRR